MKGITQATLKNIEAMKGEPFKLKGIVPKRANYNSASAAVRRFVKEGIVKKVGPGTYRATVADIAMVYNGGALNRGQAPRAKIIDAAPDNGGENIRKERIPYGPNTSLIFWGDEMLLATPATIVPKAVIGMSRGK